MCKLFRFFKVIAGIFAVCGWLCLSAQSAVAQIPPSAEAGRTQENLSPDLQKPHAKPQSAIPADALPLQQAPAGADTITFTLTALTIHGATVYAPQRLDDFYQGLQGRKISLADVFKIANDITALYRNDGYVLSRAIVPQQEIRDGRVSIEVIEGYVDDIVIRNGATLKARADIEALARNITRFRPVNIRDIERYLLLIRDLPGYTVDSLLTPSPTTPGAAALVLDVGFDPFSGSVSFDNTGTKYLGPLQGVLRLQGNSLLRVGDSLTMRYVGTGTAWPFQEQELRYGDLSYSMPVGDDGAALIFTGARSVTHPGNVLAPLDAKGDSSLFSLEGTYPLLRTRRTNLALGMQINALRSGNTVTGIETRDDLRIVRARASGDHADTMGGISQLSLEISQGIEAFGASQATTSGLSRAGGRPDFTKFNLDAARWQRLYGSFSLFAALSAQYSADRLLSPEEFGFGGSMFGRGYDPSEITGDGGVATKVEVQYNGQTPVLPGNSYQLFAFHDLGVTTQSAGKIGSGQSAASAGAGMRLNLTDDITATALIAKPLTRRVDATDDKASRGLFSLTARF